MSVESFVENKYLGLNAPEIDLGIFTMSFSSSLEGFEVSSDQSFSRREADPSVLTEDQREILKGAMRAQFGFTTAT